MMSLMVVAVSLLGISQIIALVWLFLRARDWGESKILAIETRIQELVTAPDANTPSPLAQIVDSLSQVAGTRISNQLEAKVMAHFSHISRQGNKLAEDVVQDAAEGANPLLGAALAVLPGVRKRLAKNPSALEALLPLLGRLGGGGGSSGDGQSDVAKRIKGG